MVTSIPSFLALTINGIVSLLLPQLFCPLTLKCEISTGTFASRPILIASLIASTTLSSSYLICDEYTPPLLDTTLASRTISEVGA